jgi:hypothetical protein
MPWAVAAAAVGGAASIYGSSQASKAQEKAAEQQRLAYEKQREEARATYQPYTDFGRSSLGQYSDLLGLGGKERAATALANYTESPYLPHLIKGVTDDVKASGAAGGLLDSGATLGGITDRATKLRLADYDTYLGQLQGGVNTGMSAASGVTNAGQNATAGIAGAYGAQGQAQADNWINMANSVGNFANSAAGVYGKYRADQLAKQQQPAWQASKVAITPQTPFNF